LGFVKRLPFSVRGLIILRIVMGATQRTERPGVTIRIAGLVGVSVIGMQPSLLRPLTQSAVGAFIAIGVYCIAAIIGVIISQPAVRLCFGRSMIHILWDRQPSLLCTRIMKWRLCCIVAVFSVT
jgi:hypothetical protein